MGALSCRAAKLAALISLATILSCATPAIAETADISTADTAWMIVATALVLMMTIPGLALFYSGMVRKKNVLATMAQSLAAVTIISILWVAFGYSLVFVGDGPWLGTLDRWGAGGGFRRRPDAVLGLSHVFHRMVHVRLRSARALGVGRRLSRRHGCLGFCRRPRGAS
jgi:ABC-type transport system involved in multi-copper enzyme maturation permease subunit